MGDADNSQIEKFKCQNKVGISLFANLAAGTADPEEYAPERKVSFHNYNPC